MKRNISNSFIFLLLVLLISCSTINNSVINRSVTRDLSVNYITEVEYNNKNYKIKGTIQTNRNKAVFINGFSNTLGIEIFRILITNDSVQYINRLTKEYFSGKLTSFSKFGSLNLNPELVQSFLFGSDYPPLYDNQNFLVDTINRSADQLELLYLKRDSDFSISKRLTNSHSEILSYAISNKNFIGKAEYSGFGNKLKCCASKASYSIDTKKNSKVLEVEFLNFKKNKERIKSLSIPKNYKAFIY